MFSKILVPVSDAEVSQFAIDYGIRFAKKFHSKMTFLHVVEKGGLEKAKAKILIEDLRKAAAEKGITAEIDIVEGIPSDIIIDKAEKDKANIVVMGSHGRTGVSRLLLGSVAETVVRNCHSSWVMIMRQCVECVFSRIVIAVGLSKIANHAAMEGLRLAKKTGAEVVLARVIDRRQIDQPVVLDAGLVEDWAKVAQNLEDEAKNILTHFETEALKMGVTATKSLRIGNPPEEIAKLAKEDFLGMIIMASHGRSGFKRLVLGSTAEGVLRQATCPVLVIKPPKAMQK